MNEGCDGIVRGLLGGIGVGGKETWVRGVRVRERKVLEGEGMGGW